MLGTPPFLPGTVSSAQAQTQELEPIDDPGDPSYNTPPSASDDTDETTEGTSTTIDVLANDWDSDGYVVVSSVSVASGPSNGSATVNNDGSITYTPDVGFSGTDSFTYSIYDDDYSSASATVSVTVNASQQLVGFKSLNRSVSGTMTPGVVDGRVGSNWDFTADRVYDLYYDDPEGGGIVRTGERLPQFSSRGPASTQFRRGDLAQSDGWRLIQRDFGNATSAPPAPYYILYNKYSGILRIFILNTSPAEFTHTNAKLSHASSGDITSTLAFPDPSFSATASGSGTVQETVSNAGAGWIYADFNLQSYDPDVGSASNARYRLDLTGITESDVNLQGDLSLDQITQQSTTSFLDTAADATRQGISNYGAVEDAVGSLQEEADEAENDGKWYADLLGTIAQDAANLGALPPLVGGVVGVIGSLLGDGSGGTTPLRLRGNVTLEGDITTSVEVFTLAFRVPGADHPSNPSPGRPLPAYDKPTGILSIESEPGFTFFTDEYLACVSYPPYNMDSYNDIALDGRVETSAPSTVTNPHADVTFSDLDGRFFFSDVNPNGFLSWLMTAWKTPTQVDGVSLQTPGCTMVPDKANYAVRAVYKPVQNSSQFDDFVYMKTYDAPGSSDLQNYTSSTSLAKSGGNQRRSKRTGIKAFGVEMTSSNPVRGAARWEVRAPQKSDLSVRVYNTLGRMVIEKSAQMSPRERKQVSLSSSPLSSGSYFARFRFSSSAGEKVITKRFTVVK
jgi:hypothetical protein